ncbi:DUF4438 domain-containing protein [Dehalococcoidia bacterium]|nr:DUF4438 domain-containing protein [Dehalococcoidia bacterium]
MAKPTTNAERLVMISVQGKVASPTARGDFQVDHEGKPFVLPGSGGIVYNVKTGDPVYGWIGDHIEPGVSTVADEKDRLSKINAGYNFCACIGNEAIVVSDEAKGSRGTVTGHHGGAEHVLIDFPNDVLEKLTLESKFLIRACGQGLELLDYPQIKVYNLDPRLFDKMAIEDMSGKIGVPVAAIVPGKLMGSGVGSTRMAAGDYDIMTSDKEALKENGLERLRFGDIVAITDHDNTYGRCYRKGAITIGVVIHSDCRFAGHGPGVCTIISCATPLIEPEIREGANIADILGLR